MLFSTKPLSLTKFSNPRDISARSLSITLQLLLFAGLATPALASTCDTGGANQASVASGGDCTLSGYTPITNNNGVGQVSVSGGDAVTLTGSPDTSVLLGSKGIQWEQIGNYLTPANLQTVESTSYLNTGAENQIVSTLNPVTGSSVYYNTYDSNSLTSDQNSGQEGQQVPVATAGTDQASYIGLAIGEVNSSGGTLNIDLADPTNTAAGNESTLAAYAKQSTLISVDGSGTAQSVVNWNSRDVVNMGFGPAATPPSLSATFFYNVTTYAGNIQFNGQTYDVTDAASLGVYNNALIAAIKNGVITSQAAYDTAFNAAFKTSSQSVPSNVPGIAGNDPTLAPIGNESIISATGQNATVNIAAGGQIDAENVTTAIVLDNGARLNNAGTLSVLASNLLISADHNSSIINDSTGVISAAYQAGNSINTNNTSLPAWIGDGVHLYNGSEFANLGVVNVAGANGQGDATTQVTGIVLGDSTTTASNQGVINVGVNPSIVGLAVGVENSGNFDNAAGSTIYLGRAAQYALGAATVDVGPGQATGTDIGIETTGAATNEGSIVLGSLVNNSIAVETTAATGTFVNTGTITINGAVSSAPLANFGMYANGAGIVINKGGTIVLNGLNATAIEADTAGTAISDGVIDIAAGADPATNTRNYGMVVNGGKATGTLNGSLLLNGQGAIGVVAENGGVVTVASAATPQFLKGSEQIGFLVSGAGSTINNQATNLTVATPDSVLFRIANGANYSGTSGKTPITADITGVGAQGVVAVDPGTTLSTGSSSYDVEGAGGVAISVEGGANGTISSATTINLAAAGATAGLVDGQDYLLSGAATGAQRATTLTSSASLTSSVNDVVGYIARNSGELDLTSTSNVDLTGTNTVGIDVQAGGILSDAGKITVDDPSASGSTSVGVLVSGASAQINELGNINVTSGLAGVQLINGASLAFTGSDGDTILTSGSANGILLGDAAGDSASAPTSLNISGATITANGDGAGIQNAAEIGNVTLSDVTINAGNGAAIRTATSFQTSDLAPNTLNISGSGTGFLFQALDGDAVSTDLNVGPSYVINVTGQATGTGITADTTGSVTTSGNIKVESANGGSAVVAENASSITNTGTIISQGAASNAVIDGTGANGKTITNSGTIQAVSNTALAIAGGNGNNTVDLSGGAVVGVVQTGNGNDTLNWSGGTLNGAVNMGAPSSGGSNTATIGAVSFTNASHVTTGQGADNTITFNGTTGNIITAASDNQAEGLNIGTNWNQLVVTGSGAEVQLVGALSLAGSNNDPVSVTNGGTLLVGGSGVTAGTLANTNVSTANGGTLEFNGVGSQTYSGVVSGTGNLEQAAYNGTVGTTVLTGANTYTGTTTIKAGTLQIGNGGTIGSISNASAITDNGNLEIDHSHAVAFGNVIAGTGTLTQAGSGTTTLSGTNSYSGGTQLLNGEIDVGNNEALGSGTLAMSKNTTLGFVGSQSLSNAVTLADNSTINAARGEADSISGVISDNGSSGSLVSAGAGTLTLSGANSYTGTTSVNNGVLLINGNQSAATGATSVASGATLGGLGAIGGDVTVASGAILAPGDAGTIGNLTVNGNLDLTSGSDLNFQLGQANAVGGAYNDLLTVGGNVTLAGTLNVNQTQGGTFGPGVYRLINYNGALEDSNLTIGNMPAGETADAIQTAVANQVNLVNSQGVNLEFWDGSTPSNENNGHVDGGNGTWQGSVGNDSWTNQAGTNNAPWATGAYAIFEGKAGTVTVDDSSYGAVTLSGAQFASNGYVITGGPLTTNTADTILRVGDGAVDGAEYTTTINSVIQGTGGINKTDLGTLVLTGANTYTGTTTITAGTLQLGNGGTTGWLDGTSSITDNGNLSVDRSDNVTLADDVTGTGELTQAGAGTLTLTGDNGYTGETQINSGTLALNGAGSISNSAGVNDLGVFDISNVNGGSASIQSLSGTGSVVLGSNNLDITNANDTSGNSYAGVMSGTGGLVVSGGTEGLSGGNTYTGSTNIVSNATLALIDAGSISESSGVNDLGTFDISNVTGGSSSIQSLSGDGSVALGGNTLNITNGNSTSGNIYAGVMSGAGGLTVSGGTETLSGDNTYSGDTNVESGANLILTGDILGNLVNAGTAQINSGSVRATTTNTGSLTATSASLNDIVNNAGTAVLTGGEADEVANAAGANFTANGGSLAAVTNAGTATLDDQNTVSGNVTNNAGKLTLDGDIVGGTLIANAGNFVVGANGAQAASLVGSGNGALNGTLTLANAQNTYSGALSGQGGLNISGGTEILDGKSDNFSGLTNVGNGMLEVGDVNSPSAVLGGNVVVTSGGLLRGHGTIGGNVTNNGEVYPGGTTGVLSVGGNYVQNNDGTFVTEVSPNTTAGSGYDQLAVNGSASLAGVLSVNVDQGKYSAGDVYDIISAGKGVTGSFGTVVYSGSFNLAESAYLTPGVVYKANNVYIQFVPNTTSGGGAASSPAFSTGRNYVASFFAQNNALQAVIGAPFGKNQVDRGYWMHGVGSFGHANGSNFNTKGFVIGKGFNIASDLVVGGAVSNVYASTQSGSSSVDGTSFGALAYGIYTANRLNVSVDAVVGHLGNRIHRYLPALGWLAQSANNGAYEGLGARVQYNLWSGAHIALAPYAQLSYLHTNLGAAQETNEGILNLRYNAMTTNLAQAGAGLTTSYSAPVRYGILTSWVSLGGMGSFGNPRVANTENLGTFTARETALQAPAKAFTPGVGIQLTGKAKPWRLTATWGGVFGSKVNAENLSLQADWKW